MAPMPPPPLHMDLVHAPTPPQGRTHSPVRSLVGHSNLPSIPCPCHDLPSIGLHFAPPPSCPPPPLLAYTQQRKQQLANSESWNERDSQTRCALVEGGEWGMGGGKGRGALGPLSHSSTSSSPGQRDLGVLHCSQGTGQPKNLGEICESTSFLSGMVEKAPGIWSLKAEACL